MTKYEIKQKLKEHSNNWISLVAERAGVSHSKVRDVFTGGHRDKYNILYHAENILNEV